MLEKDIIRNVLQNHQYVNAHDYAGKYVDQILLEDSSNDDIKYLATKTFRNMIRYELQLECERHTYTGSDFWDVHTMINYFLEQLKLHTIYSNTSANEVRHISETVFFTCFKEDLFSEKELSTETSVEKSSDISEASAAADASETEASSPDRTDSGESGEPSTEYPGTEEAAATEEPETLSVDSEPDIDKAVSESSPSESECSSEDADSKGSNET